MSAPRTLYDQIWESHLVHDMEDGTGVLYMDRHLVHEVTTHPPAFQRSAPRRAQSAPAGGDPGGAGPQCSHQRR